MDAENNGDVELTMQDVLEEEQELEEDAKAVLGDCDDKNCTYSEGYLPRQALYSCATCSSNSEPAGICLACSYACHEGHELLELYTKRHFRCDCGNKKFGSNRCRLYPDKEPENANNKYNQNFLGQYCTCSRPYPDPDDDTPDSMIQCIMCEDWYHGRHLGGIAPDNEDFGEMICSSCMRSHSFLYAYTNCFETNAAGKSGLKGHIKPENTDDHNGSSIVKIETGQVIESNEPHEETIDAVTVGSAKEEMCTEVKKELGTDCLYVKLGSFKPEDSLGPVFWPEGWRQVLCKCAACCKLYETDQCSFLLDEEDTIHAYEERGKRRSGNESQYDKGWTALGSLDRVKQIEAVREYKEMESQLKDYLKHFADNKQTVSKRDITDFFENIQKQKRQKVGSYVQTFCR